MSQVKTDKFPFKSRFSIDDLWITPQAYLSENMCARQAAKSGDVLPNKFWVTDKHKRNFLTQLRFATSLLKLYSIEAIIAALKTFQGKRIYSLNANWLDPLIRNEQEKVERAKKKFDEAMKQEAEVIAEPESEEIRPSFPANKQSTLSKLKDL